MSVRKATRPAIFKWRQTAPELIVCAVRWYLRYSLSLRDVESLLDDRGLKADQTTVWRWVQRYGPELEQRLPVVLARGLRRKDRLVMAAGAIAAVLTLVTHKPYLGWPRHTLDPMILGVLLIGVALFSQRWLARVPGGIRYGFPG